MPKKIPAEQKRSTVVFATLRPEERAQLERQAEATGISVSSIVRRLILRDLQGSRAQARQVR